MGTRHYAVSTSYKSESASNVRTYVPLRKFDLKVGDKIRIKEWTGEREKTEEGTYGDRILRSHVYRILAIFEHVFLCIDRLGIKTTFMKKQYQLGEVQKVDE